MAAKNKQKTTQKKRNNRKKTQSVKKQKISFKYCCQPVTPEREFGRRVNSDRAALIRISDKKWANGTRLHYYFFKNAGQRGTAAERDVVRDAFKRWKNVGIGLEFVEVDSADEAEIRIGFRRGDGAWSYVGRDVLDQGISDQTMNFGWNIRNDIDTAIHEIGHTLGFPHEHQNPNSGIEWDEEAVYANLAGPPNFWSRETTFWNIIRKLEQAEVRGSEWDKDSIMHYPFDKGMILKPEEFQTRPLIPRPGLSARDKEWCNIFYPPLSVNDYKVLKPFRSVRVTINPGKQLNFYVKPTATRWYEFGTFGNADAVMVLFEEIDGKPRYRVGDDDSGEDFNAYFEERLFAGRTYILRVRLYWQHRRGNFGVMMW
ncbi:MAG: M12 family metallopeptidase [Gammaproteobacteria bacterium]|nr:M12 family metallopeptidase [Gammaproteobacteria bacterium]